MWREQINDPNRAQALRVLEAATLLDPRRALRRGTIWAKDSLEFRERDRLLIAPARWEVWSGGSISSGSVCLSGPTHSARRFLRG